jgi:transcriptional regulator with XRE-family HTH domain
MSLDIRPSTKKLRADRDLINWKSVGHRIRKLRGFNMTQEELAARIGVSQGHLSYMERGEKEIGAEILLRITRQFGKSLEWLLVGDDS